MPADIDFARLPRQKVPRFVLSPRRILSDVLSKGWVESAIPFLAFICVVFGILVDDRRLFRRRPICATWRQYAADGGLVVLALLIVVAVGGIDLSVGSNFAMSAFAALFCFHILELPVPVVLAVSLATGALIGSVNGLLAGLDRLRRAADDARHHDHHAGAVHAGVAGAAGGDFVQRPDRRSLGLDRASRNS